MFAYKKYSINIDKDIDTTIGIFRDNLDDMTKKGYSLGGETVIYNSDHNSKLFSGEFKNDRFVVRQTTSGTDDFYYRLLPRHEISFDSIDDQTTRVSVKSKSVFAMLLSVILFFVAIFVFSMINLSVSIGEISVYNLFYSLIPIGIMLMVMLVAMRSINDTKSTLQYIFTKDER